MHKKAMEQRHLPDATGVVAGGTAAQDVVHAQRTRWGVAHKRNLGGEVAHTRNLRGEVAHTRMGGLGRGRGCAYA